ncbi:MULTISPECIES: hypothetical protein [Rhodococcus]|jgi:hypothetical protein|uniref:Uncharacterized protein n=1 Tax=Rhodococcus baikonurensis TaxID=172041 RepID=A0ABV5XAR4_9NOCA|nr:MULTISPECIES: hypothetical protein [Rhodococcus]
MKPGDTVTIGEHGASVFKVVADGGPDHLIIESVEDAPGKYQFPSRRDGLFPHQP